MYVPHIGDVCGAFVFGELIEKSIQTDGGMARCGRVLGIIGGRNENNLFLFFYWPCFYSQWVSLKKICTLFYDSINISSKYCSSSSKINNYHVFTI